ncbi:MAG: hypothetical protein ACI837_003049 [Crocinitomicaceae bacterium]|jgi:hypothetical protein
MKYSLALLLITFFASSVGAQTLLPSIGQATQPSDSDQICYFPVTIDPDNFLSAGPEVGDTMPDFTLYDMADVPFTYSNSLGNGKYTLLIQGSYTCPVFRNKVASINNVVANYAPYVSTYVVYGMEAHPNTPDTSLYFGNVNVTPQNTAAGILFLQPLTYGERKDMVTEMNANLSLTAPVLLDGPCNEFLTYFGPAPNNAFLVDTNGIIVVKHPWYDKLPLNMVNDLDSILTGFVGPPNGTNGDFAFTLDADSIAYGNSGDVLTVGGEFINNSLSDDVIIDITRAINDMPDPSWTSSMCIDACLPTTMDQYTLHMLPNTSQHFIMYFFTGTADIGHTEIVFENANNPLNIIVQNFYGNTASTSLAEILETNFSVFPNPANEKITVRNELNELIPIEIYNSMGSSVKSANAVDQDTEIDISELQSGLYYIRVGNATKKLTVQ